MTNKLFKLDIISSFFQNIDLEFLRAKIKQNLNFFTHDSFDSFKLLPTDSSQPIDVLYVIKLHGGVETLQKGVYFRPPYTVISKTPTHYSCNCLVLRITAFFLETSNSKLHKCRKFFICISKIVHYN